VSGYVIDENTETLAGATIRQSGTSNGCSTNNYGFFTLAVPRGNVRLIASMAGMKPDTSLFIALKDTLLHLKLQYYTLGEVTIHAKADNRPQMSTTRLSLAQVAKIPALAGEPDIIKALSFIPGVINGGEGSSGLYVRGGTPDQNLILLDNAIVYNPNHLFGFLSVFNPASLKSVELIRGGFPARYGGRLSSVLDISMKDGNSEKRKGEFGFGLISSHAQVEGPWAKKRGSYMIAGRTAYLGVLLLPLRLRYNSGQTNEYYNYGMYDLNAKLKYRITDNRQLFLSLYAGQDGLTILNRAGTDKTENVLKWGNVTGSLRLNSQVSPRAFWKNILLFSRFNYLYGFTFDQHNDQEQEEQSKFNNISSLWNSTLKSDLDFVPGERHFIRAGMAHTLHNFVPRDNNQTFTSSDSSYKNTVSDRLPAYEAAFYVEDEWRPSEHWSVNAGFRFNFFIIQKAIFLSPEPRLSISRRLTASSSLKASFVRTQQNIHLLTNSGLGFQNDVWIPATALLPPQRTFQYALGWSKSIAKVSTELSVEVYYKKMANQIEYREGVNIFSSQQKNWTDVVSGSGVGQSYGVEFGMTRQTGRLTGMFAYTYSRTFRMFNDINNAASYPFKYDYPHNMNITGSLKLSKKWDFTASWVWHSGQPISLPTTALGAPPFAYYDNSTLFFFNNRNNARLPDYARADIGFICTKLKKTGRTAVWNFSIFNVFNRRNPLYAQIQNLPVYNPQTHTNDYVQQLKTQSFLPVLPSISYSFKW